MVRSLTPASVAAARCVVVVKRASMIRSARTSYTVLTSLLVRLWPLAGALAGTLCPPPPLTLAGALCGFSGPLRGQRGQSVPCRGSWVAPR